MDNPEQTPSANADEPNAEAPGDLAAFAETTGDIGTAADALPAIQVKPVGSELAIDPIPDTRLYVPDNEEWDVHIKRDSERLFCYSKHPGEDWFHLLLNGEIYVSRQHEKYCLRCALRMGFLTVDRLFWQHRVPKLRNRITPLS